ncbi:hypothetical protein [Pedobacter deserti]|uniref:hypothetical protein n=1 Tax=Pedobacter deserti TaxID=2817382 RepID=UPI00210D7D5D|nr:hypothetical protein [Pedobacter sp. SYSU D00382]
MRRRFHWVYLAFTIIIITSCSKEKISKSVDPNDYTLATYDLRQKGNTLVSGQNAKVQLLIRHYNIDPGKKGSAINKIEILSGNSTISSTSDFHMNAREPDFKLVVLETGTLKTGKNQLSVRIHYEAGFYDTGDFELLALKDRKLKTWWAEVSIEHLRNVKTTKTTAAPLLEGNHSTFASGFQYGNRNDEFLNIDGLYGTLFAFYDRASLQLKYINVAHGSFQHDPTLKLSAVREDILKEFPDCVVTTDGEGVITMKSLEFTFVITNIGNMGLITRVTKN